MRCTSCGEQSPSSSQFCVRCGAALYPCRRCGHANPPDFRFCGRCGDERASSATAPPDAAGLGGGRGGREPRARSTEGERRQLSVLFCDLVGSTDLSQRVDAEALHEILRAYQDEVARDVARYEGHVAQYLGDGVLAYFGYPRAFEDAAERAVLAAGEIVRDIEALNQRLAGEHGVQLSARVGIDTGLVVVGEIGRGDRRETLALGDTTNRAARLQELALPGAIVIGSETLRLVRGIIRTEDLGEHVLKGISAPVSVHRVLGPTEARSRLHRHAGRLTRFVGRDLELDRLLERWQWARAGRGQGVLLEGEAGVGKSRLVYALGERLADEPHTWLECRASPHHRHSAFHAVKSLLERGLGSGPDEGPEQALARLERGLALAGLRPAETVPLLAPLLALPLPKRFAPLGLGAELARERTIEVLTSWVLATARDRPLLLLVEDLHWADPSTLEFLGHLLERNVDARILVVATHRPEFAPPWPVSEHVTTLRLGPLSRPESRSMLRAMSEASPLPSEVEAEIVERGDGIPLFIEELTRMALEAEASSGSAIPATLRDSLMARLDRLGSAKEVAQLCAVVGREIPHALVAALSTWSEEQLDAALARLQDAELLQRSGEPPHAAYAFRHALIQEAAYLSLLRSRRQESHRRIAEVLESAFPERLVAEPETVARHWEEAGVADKAALHYMRAGQQATERSANDEAIAHVTRGIELAETLPEGRERSEIELRLRVALGTPLSTARGYADPEVARTHARALELSRAIGDAPQLAQSLWGLSAFYLNRGELGPARDVSERLLAVAERSDDSALRLRAHLTLGQVCFFAGRLVRAREHFETATRLYDPDAHHALTYLYAADPGVLCRAHTGLTLVTLGDFDSAAASSREAIELAHKHAHGFSLANALGYGAIVHQLRGERARARALAEETLALASERGFPFWRGMARVLCEWADVESHPEDAQLARLREALGRLAGTGGGVGGPYFLGLLADAQQTIGRPEEALTTVGVALSYADERGIRFRDADLRGLEADLLLATGRAQEAEWEARLRRAIEIAREQQARSLELVAATRLARGLVQRGRAREVRGLLEPILRKLTEGNDLPGVRTARELVAELP